MGCSKNFSDLDEFEKYINSPNSPFLQTKIKSGAKVSVRYLPTDAMMINHYRMFEEDRERVLNDTSLTQEQKEIQLKELKDKVLAQKKSYDRSIYFQLNIGFEDESKDIVYDSMKRGYGTYSEWLQKLMFHLKEYIYLRTELIDEVPLDIYHLERSFGMTKDRKILLLFPNTFNDQNLLDKSNENITLVLKEFGLKTGRLKFTYDLPMEVVEFNL